MNVYTLLEIWLCVRLQWKLKEGLKLGDFAIIAYTIIVKVHVQLTSH